MGKGRLRTITMNPFIQVGEGQATGKGMLAKGAKKQHWALQTRPGWTCKTRKDWTFKTKQDWTLKTRQDWTCKTKQDWACKIRLDT